MQTAEQFADGPSAIWEYTSNSLEYRESPLNCKINIQIDKKQIIISDNSDGMDEEILKYFFTVSGENQARKGKQKSWLKRGKFGTGKLAAFGIANQLQVETVKDGLKNIYFLSRQMIEETPGIGIVFILFLIHKFINNLPGSDNRGVPASEINDKILPSLKY